MLEPILIGWFKILGTEVYVHLKLYLSITNV